MKAYKKKDFPVSEIRRFLEPGPITLISSKWKDKTNIMAHGWHTVLEFSPSLVGCMISNTNYSFDLIRKSKECVINIPTLNLAKKVVDIGNSSGERIDKFKRFNLTPAKASKVKAPLIKQCFANLECRLKDSAMIDKYNFFIFEVVKAHAPTTPRTPQTIHYSGDGVFMVAGKTISLKR